MNPYTVLLCDDSVAVRKSMTHFLQLEGIHVLTASDGMSVLTEIKKTPVDLIILDIMLPDISGTDVCREIRKTSDVPIIFLSAKSEEIDRILGLELGGDDYVTKPFSPRELTLRVKKLLLRSPKNSDIPMAEATSDHEMTFHELRIDPDRIKAFISDREVEMSAREIQFLAYLLKNKGRVLNREQILKAVWGYDYFGDTRAVDSAVKRIRRKLAPYDVHFQIESVYSAGYRLGDTTK